MVDTASDGVESENHWAYDPHIDPALNFDSARAGIETLIDDALGSNDEAQMRAALEQLKRMQAPYLNWTGKAERTRFEVDTVSLHVHERIDPATILAALQKQIKSAKSKGSGAFQPDLFSAPFENLPLREAIDFYKHERDWANRLIAGDSLLVMNSLLQKESMAGQVQMIYLDPPYGIKYGSNFQPFTDQRDVSDSDKDEDLTQEPEMIKAFRDTWELGIHSYLTYLRDRLLLAKELLHESGSVFVQISDDNLHHVREVMDEIFGTSNHVCLIAFRKTGGTTSDTLSTTVDFIVWYAKDISRVKYRPLYLEKSAGGLGAQEYKLVQLASGNKRGLSQDELQGISSLPPDARVFATASVVSDGTRANTSDPFAFNGFTFDIPRNKNWKTSVEGMKRLCKAGRIEFRKGHRIYRRFMDDFPVSDLNSVWLDVRGALDRAYVVETSFRVIERCLLMTTDPGDLVLDPTCGSGTTAFVAEKWGRRWITCDTSRVAITLAKQRLMTAQYDYYPLKYPDEGMKSGFIYKTVPHVKLGSIANNEPSKRETLYDKPFKVSGIVRVTGPFTVEAVPSLRVKPFDRNMPKLELTG
ncbi:MAG: site-specific DNA-methyltransferase, partial [Candidatus Binatia bacterium]